MVLAGGGITGFLYEVGVLTALEESGGEPSFSATEFDFYVGTSAGSVLAALLANGARPREIFDAISQERKHNPLYFSETDILGIDNSGALGLAGKFFKAMVGTLRRALKAQRWPTLAQMLADFQAHHPPGFYSTEVLQATLCERFTTLGYRHHFHQLARELYVIGTDIDTGEPLLFGGDGEFRDLHICRAVAASCAIPIFFRPIRIGERDVVDGSISSISPLEVALARGAGRIVFINPLVPILNDRARVCLPLDEGHCARLTEKGVGWIGDQALRLMLAVRTESVLRSIREQHAEIDLIAIEPGRDEIPMFMHNAVSFSAGKEVLAYGYESGRKFRHPADSAAAAAPAPSAAPAHG